MPPGRRVARRRDEDPGTSETVEAPLQGRPFVARGNGLAVECSVEVPVDVELPAVGMDEPVAFERGPRSFVRHACALPSSRDGTECDRTCGRRTTVVAFSVRSPERPLISHLSYDMLIPFHGMIGGTMTTRRTIRLALVAGLVIAAAACGDDDDDSGGDARHERAGGDDCRHRTGGPAATEPPAPNRRHGTEGTDAGSGQQVAETSGESCTYDPYGGEVSTRSTWQGHDRVRPVRA